MDYKLLSAAKVPPNSLICFYQWAFENRIEKLSVSWQWLNRTDFLEDKIPLVLYSDGKVIAHAGMIPFNTLLNGDTYTAGWYIDFKILDEYQRKGLGTVLTNEWVKQVDCCVTFCNEKSLGVFKKAGWLEGTNTFQHINYMCIFDHPGVIRKLPSGVRRVLNFFVTPFFFLLYKTNAYGKKKYMLEKLSENNFNDFYELYLEENKNRRFENSFSPVRDEAYVNWRILSSPNRDNYYIYTANDFKAVVSFMENHGKYIDVLWVSDNQNTREIKKMIATLGCVGIKQKRSYMRFYTSHKNISAVLRKTTFSQIRHHEFAYYSKNKDVFKKMQQVNFDFELIDNDFEHIK